MSFKHICTLQKEEKPIQDWKTRLVTNYFLISAKHPNCSIFFKSKLAVELEKKRHLAQNYIYVMHTFSKARILYKGYSFVVNFFALIFYPIEVTLMNRDVDYWSLMIISCICDILTLFEPLATSFTGFINYDKTVELRPKYIFKNYLRTWFVPDVISSIPVVLIDVILAPFIRLELRLTTFVDIYVFRIFRIRQVNKAFQLLLMMTKLTVIQAQLLQYLLNVILILHWLIFIICNLSPVTAVFLEELGFEKPKYDHDIVDTYAESVVRGTALLFTIQHEYMYNGNVMERTVITLMLYYLYVFFTLIMVAYLQFILQHRYLSSKYKNKLNQVQMYLHYKQLPLEVQYRVRKFYDYKFHNSFIGHEELLGALSPHLQLEVYCFIHRRLVQGIDILKDLSTKLLYQVIANLKEEIYMPNDIIIKAGNLGDGIYFLSSGTVAIYTPAGNEICHLLEPSYFGEMALVNEDRRRKADVRALEICTVYRLDRKIFKKCFPVNTPAYNYLLEVAKRRKEEIETHEEKYKKTLLDRLLKTKRYGKHI